MTTATLTAPTTFAHQLTLAREEAIAVLRAVMRQTDADADDETPQSPAPTRDARLAACAVLRLPIPETDDADTAPPQPQPRRGRPTSAPPHSRPHAPPHADDPIYPTPPAADRLSISGPDQSTKLLSGRDPSLPPEPANDPLGSILTSLANPAHRTPPRSPASLMARAGAPPPGS